MYSRGKTYFKGDTLATLEVSFTCTTIDLPGHEGKLHIHNDEGELRDKILVWLNASPERQQSFINEDDLKEQPPTDPLKFIFTDCIQSIKLAEANNDLESYLTMHELLKVLKKAYPLTAEEYENAT